MRSYWTYILASKPRGTLYIGVTNGLPTRVEQHRSGEGSAFTCKYGVHTLVWFEEFADIPLFWFANEVVANPKVVGEWVYPGLGAGRSTHFHLVKPAK